MEALDQYKKIHNAYDHFNRDLFGNSLPGAFITFQSRGGGFGYYGEARFRNEKQESSLDEIALNPDYFFYGELELAQTLAHEICHQWQKIYGKPSRNGYHNKEWANKMIEIGLMPSSTGKEGGKITGQNMGDYPISGGMFEVSFANLEAKGKIIDWGYFSWESHRLEQIKIMSETSMHLTSSEGIKPGAFVTVGQSTMVIDEIDPDTNLCEYHSVAGPALGISDETAFIKVPKDKNYRVKVRYSCPKCGMNVWGKEGLHISCLDCSQPLEPTGKSDPN